MYLEELFWLKDKVAVVIGGSGVLGGAMATGLAQAGASVGILGRTRQKVEARANEIASEYGAETLGVPLDASSKPDLVKAREAVLERFGKVDILVNAPGINSATAFFEIREDEWHRILDVNLKSVFLACQVFGETLIQQGRGGSVINISSMAAGPPLSRVFTYGISKAGINNLTQFLAREWAPHGVRVNAIAPGFFPAEQNREILSPERKEAILKHTPMGRYGEPWELVGATLWLASEKASSFVTGAIIRVDGGFSATTI